MGAAKPWSWRRDYVSSTGIKGTGWILYDGRGRGRANVWPSGTWHTWDEDGVGGENGQCEGRTAVQDAMDQVMAAVVRQGWTPWKVEYPNRVKEGEAMQDPPIFYFGPLREPGHFLFDKNGVLVSYEDAARLGIPWSAYGTDIDGVLQPGCKDKGPGAPRPRVEGEALLHHKDGWTALSFWDSSVDSRPGCNSTFIAKGHFTAAQMIGLAKSSFPDRCAKMKFQIRPVPAEPEAPMDARELEQRVDALLKLKPPELEARLRAICEEAQRQSDEFNRKIALDPLALFKRVTL